MRPPRKSELESWAKTLETRGELVFMADVAPAGAASWLGSSEKPHLPVDLVGVCVIRARDRASALETARHSPHFGAGGLVAVYEIDPE